MLMGNYYIGNDENGELSIFHADISSRRRRTHKYLAKIGEGRNARYFYTQEALRAYLRGNSQNNAKNVSTRSISNLWKPQWEHTYLGANPLTIDIEATAAAGAPSFVVNFWKKKKRKAMDALYNELTLLDDKSGHQQRLRTHTKNISGNAKSVYRRGKGLGSNSPAFDGDGEQFPVTNKQKIDKIKVKLHKTKLSAIKTTKEQYDIIKKYAKKAITTFFERED